jgi:signal peptidase I
MPQRGDVVVFRLPSDPNVNYIKRVIGLPGDEILYANHQLTINGVVAPLELEETTDEAEVFSEILNERRHDVMVTKSDHNLLDGLYRVPDGHYFMMGDNRNNSRDSRYIGAIPETHLVGEAVRIWMHMDGIEWPDWGRIGTKIE